MKTESNESLFKRLNILPRIVCLFCAFIIWIYVMEVDSPDYEEVFENVPVSITGTDVLKSNSLSVISQNDLTVDVTVKGQKSVIKKYSSEDISVTADVSSVNVSGFSVVALSFDLPSDLSFVGSSVNEVKLFIDNSTTVNVEVRPHLVHWRLSEDYELGEVTSDVSTLQVTGPKSVLENISYASVEIDMDDTSDQYLTKSFSAEGSIALKNEDGDIIDSRYLKLSQTTAKVHVSVYAYKDVALKVNTKYGYFNDTNSEITVSPEIVHIKGEPSVINSIDSIDLTTINEHDIGKDTTLTVAIDLPDGIYLASDQFETATVTIKLLNMVRKTLSVPTDSIKVTGADGISYSFAGKSVTVDVIGPKDYMSKLTSADLNVTVDMTSYANSSSMSVYPYLDVNVSGNAYAVGTYNVQINIK